MKNNLLTLLILFFSISLTAQQTDKLYTPGGGLYPSANPDGIGINEDKPAAALHINQSDDKGTALRIDLENILMTSENGYDINSQPALAFIINRFDNHAIPNQTSLLSVDYTGTTRIGYFNSGGEKLMVGNSVGIYKSSSTNMVRLGYDGSSDQPQLVWKTSATKNFQFKNSSTGAIPISLSPDGKVRNQYG